jgi:hypothetical protein
LDPWEESMTWRGSVTMLAVGEAVPGGENKGDDASWDDVNFTGPKNKKKFMHLIQLLQMDDEYLKQR